MQNGQPFNIFNRANESATPNCSLQPLKIGRGLLAEGNPNDAVVSRGGGSGGGSGGRTWRRTVAPVTVAILPGASVVNRPESLSAFYQLQARDEITALAIPGVTVIDLTPSLQAAGQESYFLNDRHLTATGHRTVASAIAEN
jgi:hypothetical protein